MDMHRIDTDRGAFTWKRLLPSLRLSLLAVALFSAGLLAAHEYDQSIEALLADHRRLGALVFVASSAIAVVLPVLSNLPLVPLAVVAWGPAWTALLLLAGWVAGAALAFTLGRHARQWVLRRFPSVTRHADIDRLIHPRHRLLSLVLLRMTFPVDVLSHALGLFSRRTTLAENAVSTTLGAAPFALLFALVPVLPAPVQWLVLAGSVLVFVLYTLWMLRRPR